MVDLRSEGKIRGFGVGLESLQHAEDWIETGLLSSILVPFGLLDPQAGNQIIPRAARLGLPVIVRGVFAGGWVARPLAGSMENLPSGKQKRLSALCHLASSAGVSTMQLAMWFVLASPGVSTVLIGTSSVAHVKEVLRNFHTPPSEQILLTLANLVQETADNDQLKKTASGEDPT
jgi:D-threo-aldose 1-dehydrogenase